MTGAVKIDYTIYFLKNIFENTIQLKAYFDSGNFSLILRLISALKSHYA